MCLPMLYPDTEINYNLGSIVDESRDAHIVGTRIPS